MGDIVGIVARWIYDMMLASGQWGVLLALAVESACIPITSEVFLLFGGFLVGEGHFDLVSMVLAGSSGFTLGSLIPYSLGRWYGTSILGAGGRLFLAGEKELDRVEAWFDRYKDRAVLFGRFVPLVRDFISVPAGHARMPLVRFLLYTFLGSLPWVFAMVYIGSLVGSRWRDVLGHVERGNKIVLGVLAIGLLLLLIRRVVMKRAQNCRNDGE